MKVGTLTESTIKEWVDDRSFSRGRSYFRQGAIFNARQQENVLKASCQGSAPYPYRLWVELDDERIVMADCSCPVGGGGHCKHVAALLLTWSHDPDTFRESLALEATLETRDKEDLILLIRQMLARYPDLEELIDAVPVRSADAGTRVNVEAIKRQVDQALSRYDHGHAHYEAAASLAGELSAIMQLSDVYRERGEWQAVAQITCSVLDELVDSYTGIYDHDGDISSVLWDGSKALGLCLPHLEGPDERQPVLRTLLSIASLDIEMGGYGFGDDAYDLLLEKTTADEKQEIAAEIETKLSAYHSEDEFSTNWRQQSFGRWLLDLRGETLSDEQFIDLCRRSTLYAQLVDRLLALGRTQEAITEAQSVSDYELLTVADLFLQHGLAETAEQLVWERTARSDDTRLDGWLKDYALSREDWPQALAYAETRFWRRPSLHLYQEMISIAAKVEQEAEQYEKIITRLAAAEKPKFSLLVRIHLHHGNIGKALATHAQIPFPSPMGWITGTLDIELAKAAEETHPRDALQLYQRRIKRLIDARGRDNYATAAGLLKRVRSLFKRLGEMEQWDSYYSDVRNQKPRLPALLDELKKAGL